MNKGEYIKELERGQENYNKLWDMYSGVKKELKELQGKYNKQQETIKLHRLKTKDNK